MRFGNLLADQPAGQAQIRAKDNEQLQEDQGKPKGMSGTTPALSERFVSIRAVLKASKPRPKLI